VHPRHSPSKGPSSLNIEEILSSTCCNNNLFELSERFTEEEVYYIIRSLPPDKAPGPDGFTVCFLQVAWAMIKLEVMQAFDVFWHMDVRKFHVINEAIMVLLQKKKT
jgi:hypothetical protein